MSIYSNFNLTEKQEVVLIKKIDETGRCYNSISEFIGSVTAYEIITKEYLLEKLVKSEHLTPKVARLILLQSDFKLLPLLKQNTIFDLLLLEDPSLISKPPEKKGLNKYIFQIPSQEERNRIGRIRELNRDFGYISML